MSEDQKQMVRDSEYADSKEARYKEHMNTRKQAARPNCIEQQVMTDRFNQGITTAASSS